nr:hypothetical protein [Rickettsia gravesii]
MLTVYDPSAGDIGNIRIADNTTYTIDAANGNVNLLNNGGPYTIGQDNTHRLKNFILNGAGDVVVDNTVFTKLLSMNSR